MNVLVNFEFSQDSHGWSETYYLVEPGDLGAALNKATNLAQLRSDLLNSRATLDLVKVSDVDVLRDSLADTTVYQKSKPVIAAQPDNPYMAALIRIEATSLYRRSLYLRGIIKNLAKNPASPIDLAGFWGANFFKFQAALKNPALGWAVRSRGKGGDAPFFPITGVAQKPLDLSRTRISGVGFPFAVTDQVKIQGFGVVNGGNKQFNGVWSPFDPQAAFFDIPFPFALINPYTGGAKVKKYSYIYNPITNVIPGKRVRRKTGLVYGVGRGKTPTRSK